MNRKTIIIAAILLLAIGAAIAYFLLRPTGPGEGTFLGNLPIIGGRAPLAPGMPPPALPPGAAAPGSQPEARLREIISRDILAPAMSADGKSLYFVDRSNGHIMQSGLDGNNETTLANLTILETFDGLWSPLKTRIAVSYAEQNAVKRFVESTATGTPSYFLPANATAVSWSPDGRSIAYLTRQGETTNLVIADQANRGGRTVYQTPVPDFTVSWAGRNTILLVSRPSGLAPSLVLQFDTVSRGATPILTGRRGIIVLPASDGSGFLFSESSDRGEARQLSFFRFTDRNVTTLPVTTLAEKCAFSKDGKKIYCGVPRSISGPSPDAWYRGEVTLADEIVDIDLKTGQAKSLTAANLDTISLFTSADNSFLFFQDKTAGSLWRLILKE